MSRQSRKAKPPMIECGCCGRTHEDIFGMDCRAFRTCDKCGDAYLNLVYPYEHGTDLDEHMKTCDGMPNENVVEVEE